MNEYRIAVEMQPTGVPKPTGFGVFKDSSVVAFLTEEQVRTALAKFDGMMATYLGKPSPPEAEQPSIETIRLAGAVLDAKDEGWDEALEAAALEAENWEYGETAARKIREMKRLSRSEEK
jgi:hypothetical protein